MAMGITNTFSSAIGGSGALTKTENGALNLTGVNTFTGPTTISAGILSINGSTPSPIAIQSGATLKGSGKVANCVTVGNGGSLAPRNSIGTITVVDLTLASGSSTSFDFSPTANAKLSAKNH